MHPPENADQEIDLTTALSLRASFSFPLQSKLARREIVIGGLWLLVPGIGWLLNMGHRIVMVHNMQHGRSAWPAWSNYPALLRHGAITFLGMLEYHAPAIVCGVGAWLTGNGWLWVAAVVLWIPATIAVPGFMSHYCLHLDAREIFDPLRAMSRVFEGGAAYWRAWTIVLLALALSFVGLLALGVGFLFTSVWFWQAAGFSFATVFSEKFGLRGDH
ncbi:MAG: hypothetical protein GKS06_09780 [Acidobacteria bacterium]|nr:hypothetical protein [Acidobacteriota bacterium]